MFLKCSSQSSMKRNGLTSGRAAAVPLAVFACLAALPAAHAADRIILRNLKVLTDKTVTSFDEDGVRLSDSTTLGWHEIEKARISESQQAAFDKMLAVVGNDLYRIRQRLSVGDYEGLLPHAEALADRYAPRTSNTAYMVLQSLMWGQLAAGHREAALISYLRCYSLMRSRGTTKISLPGERRLKFDPKTALSEELVPVWFDREAAKSALPIAYKTIRAMKARPSGVYIYLGTLAAAAGDDKVAASVLQALRSDVPQVVQLRQILEAQREVLGGRAGPAVKRLSDEFAEYPANTKPLAMYWLGRDLLQSEDVETQQQGLLRLLRIPALHGESQPDLAAGALFESMQALNRVKDVRGSVTIRRELFARYSNTYHARQLKSVETKSTAKNSAEKQDGKPEE